MPAVALSDHCIRSEAGVLSVKSIVADKIGWDCEVGKIYVADFGEGQEAVADGRRGWVMGYVDKNLMPSEQIIWRGREWWWSALGSTLLVAGLALLMVLMDFLSGLAWFILIISSLWLLAKYIGWRAQDYAVTSYRVLSKRGAISQRVEEVPLRTVESTLIQQGLVDRVFKVGTVVVTGTGGTRVAFRSVAEAADLRRHVQTLVSELRQGQTQRFMQPPPNPQIAFG